MQRRKKLRVLIESTVVSFRRLEGADAAFQQSPVRLYSGRHRLIQKNSGYGLPQQKRRLVGAFAARGARLVERMILLD